MELFKAVTEARSVSLIVGKICGDNGIHVDLTSPDGFGSQSGKLAELLGIEVWISLKMIQEANPWPSKISIGDLTEETPDSYRRFRRACLVMISIFDSVPGKLLLTRPQPADGVVQQFVQHAISQSVDNGPFRLLENGSIVHSTPQGFTLKSPLFLRPRVTFPRGSILLSNMMIANSLRERMREIMVEAEERDNRRKKSVK